MRLRLLGVCAALAVTGLLSGCAAGPRFEWGGYEGALYSYAKRPDQRPGYQAALERAVERGRKTNTVAPGLLAELGFLHLEDGDTAGAVTLFNEEMTRFPESKPFLSSIVNRATGAKAATTNAGNPL